MEGWRQWHQRLFVGNGTGRKPFPVGKSHKTHKQNKHNTLNFRRNGNSSEHLNSNKQGEAAADYGFIRKWRRTNAAVVVVVVVSARTQPGNKFDGICPHSCLCVLPQCRSHKSRLAFAVLEWRRWHQFVPLLFVLPIAISHLLYSPCPGIYSSENFNG